MRAVREWRFFFDDGLNAPLGVADDPAIVGGVGQFSAENRCGSFAASVSLDERRESFCAQQRGVSWQNDHQFRAGTNRAPSDLQRVPGAALRLLQDGSRT